jgi:hypothetical protein
MIEEASGPILPLERRCKGGESLATVLFIVGISTHLPLRSVRLGLVGVGAALLVFGAIEIFQLPGPPT